MSENGVEVSRPGDDDGLVVADGSADEGRLAVETDQAEVD